MILNKPQNKKQLTTKLVSASREFLEDVGKILHEELGIITKIYTEKEKYYTLHYGAKESFVLLDWIYKDVEWKLERKYNAYLKALEINAGNGIANCLRCGTEIMRLSNHQRWCSDCKKIVVREQDRKRRKSA